MDNRTALSSGDILSLPGMACHIESEVGRGSNAIVYRAWYRDLHSEDRHEVLIKELFPLHLKGAIRRGADGRILRDTEGEAAYEIHRLSFESGNAAHLALLRACPDDVGANLNTFELNDTLYTVLGFSGGHTLREEQTKSAVALRPLIERTLKLLDALSAFHEGGLLHLDIAPDNIMLLGKGRRERVMLIDYNSCQPMDASFRGTDMTFSVKPGYTPPEIRSGHYRQIGPWSDLYSVAAVLFQGITGTALTPFQMTRPAPPDVSDYPCLREVPDTVRQWLRIVLYRGLNALPAKRYQSIPEMREALNELLDRIDGVGITHWALWESGIRGVDRMIRDNPALAYIRDEQSLYPINVDDGASVCPMTVWLDWMLSPAGKNTQLIAGGGMGKTTALLRCALRQDRKYRQTQPAVVYISLYGYRSGDGDHILNGLLRSLRFKSNTRNFVEARQALCELLDQPRPSGAPPILLLLLDGLNEAEGDRQPLIEEILRLSYMGGVRILITTRTEEAALGFEKARLTELGEEDVQAALSGKGLLMPEAPQMRDLLRTPLMLSIFIESSVAEGRQLNIATRDALLEAYFAALREKELRAAPDDAAYRWQLDAAVELVLPTLAWEILHHSRAMSAQELFGAVESCYKLINSRALRSVFPQWVGRSGAMRGGTRNSDEWFNLMVHDILHGRLGLLRRDEQGDYQIPHQIIEAHLVEKAARIRKKIRGWKWVNRGLLMLAVLLSLGLCALSYEMFIKPKPYNEAYAESLYEDARSAYIAAGLQCEGLSDMVDCASDAPEGYGDSLTAYELCNNPDDLSPEQSLALLEATLDTGDVMPWSGKPMDSAACEALLKLPEEMCQSYLNIARQLEEILQAPATDPQALVYYCDLVLKLLGSDAQHTADLYVLVLEPHALGHAEELSEDSKGGLGLMDQIPMLRTQTEAARARSDGEVRAEVERFRTERQALLDEMDALTQGRSAAEQRQ